ncbi:MAG: efflux RND transporter periplasmic adaptor subunit [Proteobacteria bacterium]|nr:efflux RND transporter periplasmic adaptor subunit [Pseudomonadota bacterium]MBU4294418.1 efflux RND transporter periplasmic adaptor subunit [Pseudomonadota bacterium]MCG2747600.1 efflux RND transporter periplasmic adaptor subunit [Desulfobulbaceae bacterium]
MFSSKMIRPFCAVAVFFVLLGWTPFLSAAEQAHDEQGQASKTAATIWTCSMHPQIQLPEPGQCPICFMDLIEVPRDADDSQRASLRQISFDERARKLAQVEVSPVIRGKGAVETRISGKVDYDETRIGTITAWVGGRIDKLYVDYTGDIVKNGQPLAEIYSPELLTAQAELIQAIAAVKNLHSSTLDIIKNTTVRTEQAAREKLRLLGLADKQIARIIERGTPADHITLTAPMSGIVINKTVQEGMYVKTGTMIYTIADLDHLWVNLEAYESDLQRIHVGQHVDFTVEAYPGRFFTGKVVFIDPQVNEQTRTIRVRLNAENKDGMLKPGMLVRAELTSGTSKDDYLLIPASAPLFTGKRAIAYVQLPGQEGVYEGREVVLGPRNGDFYQVKGGLKEGELVVSRGNFKIDSAIQIQARPSMMNPATFKKPEEEKFPPLFSSRLQLLNHSFITLSDAVHANDRQAFAKSLTDFRSKLHDLDGEGLPNKDKLAWKEMSMLLNSDVILASEADDRKELDRIYAAMAEHFHQVRTYFSLAGTMADAPYYPEVQAALAKLLTEYFSLQQLLAKDDVDGAGASEKKIAGLARKFLASLAKVEDARKKELINDLQEAAQTLATAQTLTEMRAAFFPLSKALSLAVSTFGAPASGPVYEQFCPMAFGNTGATWLAGSEEINNPYFGRKMLRCGEVRRQLK